MRFEMRTFVRPFGTLAVLLALVFTAGVGARAQDRDWRYRHDNGLHRGWYIGRHRGWANRTFRRDQRVERRTFRRRERTERRAFRHSSDYYNTTDRRAFRARERQERAAFRARERGERIQYRRSRRY